MAAVTRSRPHRQLRTIPVSRLLKTMAQPSGTERYTAGSALVAKATADPNRVYTHFDDIAALLRSESNIIKWCAIRAIAALAGADVDDKTSFLLDEYLAFIRCSKLVTAANAIAGAGRIAEAQPKLRARILDSLLQVEQLDFGTPECRNVAIGHALDALARLPAEVLRRRAIAQFVKRQQVNPRPSVARRAERLIASSTR